MYDPKTAARVWERVQSAPARPDLGALLQAILVLAQCYSQLAASTPSHRRHLLTLRQEALELAREINGLIYLEQGKRLPLKAPDRLPQMSLGQCCRQELEWAEACVPHRSDPRYGPIFSQWEAQARRHSRILLSLLGKP